jgi:hypothetical protein
MSIERKRLPLFFFRGMVRFVREHSRFSAATPPSLLAANSFYVLSFARQLAFLKLFNFIKQQSASQETVEPLLPRRLALNLHAGWPVEQHHASGGFVDVLAAVTPGTNEVFFNVSFSDAERLHALGELSFFIERHRS